MKNLYLRLSCLLVAFFCLQNLFAQNISMRHLSTYSTGIFDEGAAEIVAHDPATQKIFFVNADAGSIDVLDISQPETPTFIQSISVADYGDGVNSVAVKNGIVAAAVENEVSTEVGRVVFFDTDGNYITDVVAGVLPDMVLFSNDGKKVLVANEGEPNDNYDIDPEGSVTIIDLSNPIAGAQPTQVTFESFNDKRASLINKGVRIFGPNATVAQDLEPEYIALSEDGNLAYVSCQENNALIVVDVNAATAIDILPLGEKDHLLGRPVLEEHYLNRLTNWPDLGTPIYEGGETVKLGGFSGLFFDAANSSDSIYTFYTIPDRGPNNSTVSKSLAGTSQNLRPFKLPNYQARIVKVTYNLNTQAVSFDENEQIFLTRQDGEIPISGRGNIPGFDEVPVTFTDTTTFTNTDFTIDGINYHQLDYDEFGGDFEGILRDSTGTFWMCDEYRPAIYNFNENGTLIERYVPAETSNLGDTPQPTGTYGSETLPAVYSKRRANRGFEAIAYNPETHIVYAFIQTPMYNPGSVTQNQSDVIRILGINANNGQPVEEYVYLLERNRDAGHGLKRVDKIGDAVYAGNGRFYVLERDSSTPDDGDTGKKYIYEINLSGATNILGSPLSIKDSSTGPDDKTLEMMSADELVAAGINPVFKRKMLNLPSIGYHPSDKPEGLALLPNGGMAVLNDNDFGLTGAGVSDDSSLGLISFAADYGFDASNREDSIIIKPRPTLGMYQPDAIRSFTIDGKNYIITANEGDARDYDGFSEEERGDDLTLDSLSFVQFGLDTIQTDEELGRLKTTTANGDIDGDGEQEYFYSYGARSFSIWDEFGNLIFDSGDEFEQVLAAEIPADFNSTNDENDSFDNRSDDKGPEPEAVEVAEIDGKMYAFVGLERVGGIMLYDISDPVAPQFIEYLNNRRFDVAADSLDANGNSVVGDLGIEDIKFISETDSPNGMPLLVTGNEVSGTVSIFSLDIRPTISFAEASTAFDEDAGTVSVEILVENRGTIDGSFEVVAVDASTAEDGTDYVLGSSTFDIASLSEDAVNIEIELNDNAIEYDGRYLILEFANTDNIEIGEENNHYLLIKDNDVIAPSPQPDAVVQLAHLGSFKIDSIGGVAEIIAHDPVSQRVFATNSEGNTLEVINVADPENMTKTAVIDLSIYGGGVNSVDVRDEVVAVAMEANIKQDPGSVVFFDTDGNFINQVTTGALPDMVIFSPDGTKVLTANEGEPDDEYLVDPEGSITVIDISGGVMSAAATQITLESFNDQMADLQSAGVRIFGPNATVAQDLEPEYITFAGDTAVVACQENNAFISIDLMTNEIISIDALGEKDWSDAPNAFDASNRSPDIFFANWNVKSFYHPDAITSYEVAGQKYIITANEGDARDYDGYSEEERVADLVLDETVYPNAEYLQNDVLLGRLKTTTANGDTDDDGDVDQIYAYGGRSFSIFNADTKALVWDSGDQIERIIAADPIFGAIFNSTDDENEAKNRSDDKGPEPEAVVTAEIDNRFYAFIGLERIGGVMLYEITDPTNPTFLQYINTRNPEGEDPEGDLAPEGLAYIPANESPNGKPLLAVSYEVSGTVGLFEINTTCEIELGDDFEICENEPTTVTADDGFVNYLWSNGVDDQAIIVNESGTYTVGAVTEFGCEATDEITVTVLDTLNFNLGQPVEICEGEIATLTAPIGGVNYLWDNGLFNQNIDVIEAGIYGVTVRAANGCRSFDNIEVFVNLVPTVNLGGDTIVCTVDAPYILDAGDDLMYFWNTGASSQTIEVEETGYFEVVVENGFGCEADDAALVIVEVCSSTSEVELAGNLNIFPNPATDYLTIEMNDFETDDYEIEILDLTGRQIQTENLFFNGSIQKILTLENLMAGTYVLRIRSEQGSLIRRFVVLR